MVLWRYNQLNPFKGPKPGFENIEVWGLSFHRAKGLEADYTILLDVSEGDYGVPSQIEDDELLNLVMPQPETFEYAEERRLFYVALTRASRGVFLLSNTREPSRYIWVELLIVDEAERLSTTALEYLRDQADRHDLGLILIGMPGIEKRMARYPQLFSRVGFAHQYRPLQDKELTFVLTRRWRDLGLALDDADFTDAQAVAAIVRITGGNFRLLHRLFVQIERILKINGLTSITEDVVEAARSTLVIGAT